MVDNVRGDTWVGDSARLRWRVGPRPGALCGVASLCALTACSSASEPADPDRPVPCLEATEVCAERVEIGAGVYLPVYSSRSLALGDEDVTRGLIVVHGTNRNADYYFERGYLSAGAATEQQSTVVVAPRFQTSDDGPKSDEPFWTGGGWKRGDLSTTDGPSPRVSSYAAIDRILDVLTDRALFPAITDIVVTGHSAGGQVAHRFAATSRVEERTSGVAFRYVVANPSTFLYVRPERDAGGGYSIPDVAACPGYDDWHYGMTDRNTYASTLLADTIRAQLGRRDVRILLGAADSLSAQLDVSCGAMLQGPYRFERGRTLVRFMDAFYAGNGHVEMTVPSVGHSSNGMYLSQVGREALFGG